MAEERVQRRLAAILAADVVGYSRLMEADEEGTLARMKTLRKDVINPKCKRRRNTGPLRRPGSLAAGGLKFRHLIAFHLVDGRLGDVLSGTLSEAQAGLSP